MVDKDSMDEVMLRSRMKQRKAIENRDFEAYREARAEESWIRAHEADADQLLMKKRKKS